MITTTIIRTAAAQFYGATANEKVITALENKHLHSKPHNLSGSLLDELQTIELILSTNLRKASLKSV